MPTMDRMPTMEKSFVVLSVKGETVGSVENPPQDVMIRREEGNNGEQNKRKRRNLLWECLSNTIKSKKEKNTELTAKLQHQEVVASSISSSWSNTSAQVPYAKVGGSQTSNLPLPRFARERLERHEHWQDQESAGPKWGPSSSSSQYSSFDSHVRINGKNSESDDVPTSRLKEFTEELKFLFTDLIEYSKAKTWKKKILTVLLCIVGMLVFYDLLFGKQDYIVTWLHAFIVWMTDHSAAAVFSFVGIFVLSTLVFVPPTLLVFGAGYAFTMAMDNALLGVTAATMSCFLGSCIGAIIAFLRSKYMMRDLVQLFANRYPLVRAVDQALKVKHGFRIMLLLRLCPIIPFNSLNYCCGITGVTLHDFSLSLVGVLPFQVFTIILGATAGTIELQDLKVDDYTTAEKWTFVGFIITGVLFCLVAIVYAYKLVKQELKRELNLSTDEFECVISSSNRGGSSSQFSFQELQEGGETSFRSKGEMSESSEQSTAFQEEGEEWFWVWA